LKYIAIHSEFGSRYLKSDYTRENMQNTKNRRENPGNPKTKTRMALHPYAGKHLNILIKGYGKWEILCCVE